MLYKKYALNKKINNDSGSEKNPAMNGPHYHYGHKIRDIPDKIFREAVKDAFFRIDFFGVDSLLNRL